MRRVGGPEHRVRANGLRQHARAPLDWRKADPAVPLAQLAGPGLHSGVVTPLVVAMAIHTIEPECNPTPIGLEKANAHRGETCTHAAPHDAHSYEHHLYSITQ